MTLRKTARSSGTGRGNLAWLAPLFLSGSSLRVWLLLLWRHAGRIHWRCWLLIPLVTVIVAVGSVLGLIGQLLFSRAVKRRPMAGPPVFVLGHWRSGTTLLHELITLDERFAYPSNYECFQSCHFLVTGPLVHWLSRSATPIRRPMDGMTATLSSPGEDEAALRNLGAASFYNNLFFPSRAEDLDACFDLQKLPPEQQNRWKHVFALFLQQLNYRHGRPLVMKSPTRTAHVQTLLELYPDARFVNIVRDPREVHPSTMKMGRSLTEFACMEADSRVSEECVFATHRLVHEKLKEARPMIPAGQFCETRFENLVRDPIGEMARIYDEIGLGDFTGMKPKIEGYFAQRSDVRAARHELSAEQRAKIETELATVIEETGY